MGFTSAKPNCSLKTSLKQVVCSYEWESQHWPPAEVEIYPRWQQRPMSSLRWDQELLLDGSSSHLPATLLSCNHQPLVPHHISSHQPTQGATTSHLLDPCWRCSFVWWWRTGGYGEVMVTKRWWLWRGDGYGEVMVMERWWLRKGGE